MSHAAPTTLGPFLIERQLATGASSTVFAALNSESGRKVALKLFHKQLVSDPIFSTRLHRESEALSVLSHPNIVKLIHPWKVDGELFLELELVEGQTLKEWLGDRPPQWLEPRLWILAQVARALSAVHEQEILHRDLKPENILIATGGIVKLTDFGLARAEFFKQQLTQTGSLVGSLAYMAPETIEGRGNTFASDIFSFGVVAYEILCGRHPFMDDQGQLQTHKLLAGQFAPMNSCNPSLPSQLREVFERCLNKEPAQRPSSIWLLEAALMDHLQRSGELTRVKAWLRTGDTATLTEILNQKNLQMKREIETSIQSGVSSASLLTKLNEFHALFPDDPAIQSMMASITGEGRPKLGLAKWGRVSAVLLILFVGVLGYMWLPSSPQTSRQEVAFSQTIEQKPSSQKMPEQEAAPSRGTARAQGRPSSQVVQSSRVQSKVGRLKLLVDPEVRVFVDGRRLSTAELKNLELTQGRHDLLLEMEGYLPIERAVQIRPGRVTVVNARSGGEQ